MRDAHQRFFLGQLFEGAVGLLGFQFTQTLDGCTDGLVVGQHAAQPAVADVRHAGTLRLSLMILLAARLVPTNRIFLAFRQRALDDARPH
jgi:hypothetical protein